MFALAVVATPSANSFSHAMAAAAVEVLTLRGHAIALQGLYAEQFDPVQPTGEGRNTSSNDALVEQHCRMLARADLILVFHPIWWGQPPAILKGWVDRVFRLGTAYDYPQGVGPEGIPVGLLRARQALVFNTSNTPIDRERATFGDPLETLWKRCIFELCGVQNFVRRSFAPMAISTDAERAGWLYEVTAIVEEACRLPANGTVTALTFP